LENKDLTAYAEVAVPAAAEANYLKVIEHSRKVKAAIADNQTIKKARDGARL